MKILSGSRVLLYYRTPYEDTRGLICACESEKVASEEIRRLREEWPDAYPEPERFETELVRYLRRAY